MTSIDTSAEAVKLVLGYLRMPRGRGTGARVSYSILDELVPQVLGLLDERDTIKAEWAADLVRKGKETTQLRKDVAEARNAALLQAIGAVVAECTAPEGTYDMRTESAIAGAEAGTIAVAVEAIKALKTPIEET